MKGGTRTTRSNCKMNNLSDKHRPDEAVIIAAGTGSRLWNGISSGPKTLLPYADGTVLSAIMRILGAAGIKRFIIVVGYKGEEIRRYLKRQGYFGFDCRFVINDDWQKGNALSVLAAQKILGGELFLLSMSDHLVTPGALNKIIADPSSKNLLLVDKRVEEVFDISDATKVHLEVRKILRIGKNLDSYNGIDCGIFKFNRRIFPAIEKAVAVGNDSISAAVSILIENDDFEAVIMDPEDRWIDIDTPEAYRYCLEKKIV